MKTNNILNVYFDERQVGTLALTKNRMAAFEYDDTWLKEGFSISPFSLPLEKKVFVPTKNYFNGLFGVFADSLPDAWGNLLLNRVLRRNGINADDISILDRLAIVGDSGMGALTYKPAYQLVESNTLVDLDQLARACKKVLEAEYTEELDTLYKLGGASGGARPKVLLEIDDEEWMIKFPAHIDLPNAGEVEYRYSLCVRKCGISMTETRLFPSQTCGGYFGIKRFDRVKTKEGHIQRIHMLTAAALLELDFEQPSLDYHSLMKLTKIITRSDMEVENMFRRACFNVFAHNRDDHSKNFTFLYDEKADFWHLSPAYDMTYSTTYYGEHTTTVDGNGKNPGDRELLQIGLTAGMTKKRCADIIAEIKEKTRELM